MNKYISLAVIALVFLAAYFAGQFFSNNQDNVNQQVYLDAGDCSPVLSVCNVISGQAEIKIHFLQQPSALQPFDVEVVVSNLEVEKVNITFIMDKMDMGFNSFVLKRQSQQRWKAKAILPVCSLARNDWIAQLKIKKGDTILRSDFRFEVN